jgi:hypothetical protein
VEHFALGKRRLELFGEDHNIRAGWITVGKNLSSSNFNAQVAKAFQFIFLTFMDILGLIWETFHIILISSKFGQLVHGSS